MKKAYSYIKISMTKNRGKIFSIFVRIMNSMKFLARNVIQQYWIFFNFSLEFE